MREEQGKLEEGEEKKEKRGREERIVGGDRGRDERGGEERREN